MATLTNPYKFYAPEILKEEVALSMFALAPKLIAFMRPDSHIELAFEHTGQYLAFSVIDPMEAGLIAQVEAALDAALCHPPEPHHPEDEPAQEANMELVSVLFATGREVLGHICTHSLNVQHGAWLQHASAAHPVKGFLKLIVNPLEMQVVACVYSPKQSPGRALREGPSMWNLSNPPGPTFH